MNESKDGGKTIRLNRYLAQCGLGSRRECDRLIDAGGVYVNGTRITTLGTVIDPSKDVVTFRGKTLSQALPLEYVAYHKSRGELVTASDPHSRRTIYDALERIGFNARHLRYAGRLDRDSEGLLILSNDGDLLHALTHPRFHIKKTYQVRINRPLHDEHARLMVEDGIESEGQVLRAGKVRKRDSEHDECWYEVDLYEGRNRQIRRMFGALGYDVLRLRRTQFGVVKLGALKRGSVRYLQPREVQGLRRLGFSQGKTSGHA